MFSGNQKLRFSFAMTRELALSSLLVLLLVSVPQAYAVGAESTDQPPSNNAFDSRALERLQARWQKQSVAISSMQCDFFMFQYMSPDSVVANGGKRTPMNRMRTFLQNAEKLWSERRQVKPITEASKNLGVAASDLMGMWIDGKLIWQPRKIRNVLLRSFYDPTSATGQDTVLNQDVEWMFTRESHQIDVYERGPKVFVYRLRNIWEPGPEGRKLAIDSTNGVHATLRERASVPPPDDVHQFEVDWQTGDFLHEFSKEGNVVEERYQSLFLDHKLAASTIRLPDFVASVQYVDGNLWRADVWLIKSYRLDKPIPDVAYKLVAPRGTAIWYSGDLSLSASSDGTRCIYMPVPDNKIDVRTLLPKLRSAFAAKQSR
jgi:hypothetical protein